jgi:cephalosporin-C deacetylase-like acetyl esterase
MSKKVRFACTTIFILPFALAGVIWLAGTVLSHPVHRTIGALPSDVKGYHVRFASASGVTIHGWLIDGIKGNGAIILMHAVRDSRALFNAAQEPKEGWVVQGAAHENLHRFAKTEYERRVLQFFAQALR